MLLRLFLVASVAFGQAAFIKDGNVFFTAANGRATQITSSGLDSDPSLSLDKKLIAFVRRTPSLKIQTGVGLPVDKNELWIADATGKEAARRVLVGHTGGFLQDENLVLAGFFNPQFSPDARKVYFGATTWATSFSFRMLDLGSGRVRFLYAGISLEVLQSGNYAGDLIALKVIPSVTTARIFRYWLLDRDGHDIGEIGGSESDASAVEVFKREHN